jgi:competence protein ComEC
MLNILEWSLLKISSHILHSDDYHVEGYALLLFILGLHVHSLWILFFFYVFFIKKLLKIPFLLGLLLVVTLRFYQYTNQDIPETISGIGSVISIRETLYDDQLVLIIDYQKYQLSAPKERYQLGDQLKVDAKVNRYRKRTIPFGFNLNHYYMSQGVLGYLTDTKIEYINHRFHMGLLRSSLSSYMDGFSSSPFMKTMLLGESSLDQEGKELFRDLNMIHLLSVSGLHIYSVVLIIEKILFYFSVPRKAQKWIILCIYLSFLYLNDFSMATTRLILMYLFLWLNEDHKLRFSKLDLIQFVFMSMLLVQIELIFNLGFLITYIILNALFLLKHLYSKHKGYTRRFIISIIVFLCILPFQLSISPLMLLLLPILMLLIIYPLFISLIFTLFVPELDEFLNQGILLLMQVLEMIRDKNEVFFLPALSPLSIMLYYGSLIYMFRSKKIHSFLLRSSAIILLFSLTQIRLVKSEEVRIYFLDVGQGDSIYVESNKCNLLIDAYNNSHSFLKNMGVYQLDYLILTHSDFDHTKEAQLIIDHIIVNKLYISAFDKGYPLYHLKSKHAQRGDFITCGDIKIEFLSPFENVDHANDASLVFKLTAYGKTILFTGDIEKEIENELALFYKEYLKSDIIKISHHGSSTSSSELFLDYVSPTHAIISVGENNRYGFPHIEIINRLKERSVETYRTDRVGTIVLTLREKKEKWAFYLPF